MKTTPERGRNPSKREKKKTLRNYAAPPDVPESTNPLLWWFFEDPSIHPGFEDQPLTPEQQKIYDEFFAYLQSVGLDPVQRPTHENQGEDAPKRTIYVRVFIKHYEAVRKKGLRMGILHITVPRDPFEEKHYGPTSFLPRRVQGLESNT